MTTVTELPSQFIQELEKVIVGQRDHLELVLATLLSQGHLLLEDRPGVGKTVLARALGIIFGVPFGRIQGTPDLLQTDVTGVHVFQPNTGEWEFRAGPVFTSLLLVDELNRATPKAQSALLEAMAEGQVTIDGHTYSVGSPSWLSPPRTLGAKSAPMHLAMPRSTGSPPCCSLDFRAATPSG